MSRPGLPGQPEKSDNFREICQAPLQPYGASFSAELETRDGRRRRLYRTQVAGMLAAAFALSLAYSIIVTFSETAGSTGVSVDDARLERTE